MGHLLVVLVGIPLLWHLAIVIGTVYDAGRTGMSPWKWGTIALVVPLFGAFAYVLERSDRQTDEAIYDDGTYNVHESTRAENDPAGDRYHEHPDGGDDDRLW